MTNGAGVRMAVSGDMVPGSSTGGLVFTGCEMQAAAHEGSHQPQDHDHAHARRREVVVNGKRVKTIDVHAHCCVPKAMAVINQPLWQAAVRFGFKPAKILYLKTLAGWASPEVGYVALGRELVITAQELGPKWAAFLSEEYRRRGLPVPDPHIDVRQN